MTETVPQSSDNHTTLRFTLAAAAGRARIPQIAPFAERLLAEERTAHAKLLRARREYTTKTETRRFFDRPGHVHVDDEAHVAFLRQDQYAAWEMLNRHGDRHRWLARRLQKIRIANHRHRNRRRRVAAARPVHRAPGRCRGRARRVAVTKASSTGDPDPEPEPPGGRRAAIGGAS